MASRYRAKCQIVEVKDENMLFSLVWHGAVVP